MRSIRVGKLDRARLQEARHRNEAAVYLHFDEWLDGLEQVLERKGRAVLMLFDEFEKIEEAGQAGYLDLGLLLDWFRTAVQNRSHVALLFSAVHTFTDMSASWSGYVVSASTLRMS